MNTLETASREEILNFKLMCKDESLPDEQIDHIFLKFLIINEKEIFELLDILSQYRPKLYEKYKR